MPAGGYTVTVAAPGYGTLTYLGDSYDAGETYQLTAELTTGAQTVDLTEQTSNGRARPVSQARRDRRSRRSTARERFAWSKLCERAQQQRQVRGHS